METVQIVLDKRLLQATDGAARRLKWNRSSLVREALQEYLKRLEVRISEERDRAGYAKQPQAQDESFLWEAEGDVAGGIARGDVPDNRRETDANVSAADGVSPLASAPEREPLCLTDFEPLAKAKMSAMG